MTRTMLPADATDTLRRMAEAAQAGGQIARGAMGRRSIDAILQKAPRDYQTDADIAVERAIVEKLRGHFPDHGILGEEGVGDHAAAQGAPIFIIDPIDGTTNFAWGIPHFGVVISLVVGGEVVAGITYDPMLEEMFAAEASKGAWLNGARLDARGSDDTVNAVIGAGLPIPGQVRSVPEETYHAALRRCMDRTAGVRRMGSSALSIAYVAAGRFDGFFEDMLSLHDYGASMLVLREAGGIVTGLDGGPVGNPGGVLAATAAMHPWLLEGFAQARAA